MTYLVLSIILLALLLIYFKIADRFNIIDKPNHRSSHTTITIRGGGVIFALAALLYFFVFGLKYPYFMLGLVFISTISFLDDLHTLNNKVRLIIHLIAVLLIFYQWGLFVYPWYWLVIAGIFVIATLNAYNFMDGINGIMGGYSLVAIVTIYYLNQSLAFTEIPLLILAGIATVIFSFFNFRKNAKCFAGDVGSISLAFLIIFFMGQLIIKTANIAYVFLLLIYGLDTLSTLVFRLIRKENIFEAHRSHFYQFLANEKKIAHPLIALLYMIIQLLVNIILVFVLNSDFFSCLIFSVLCGLVFVGLRFQLEGKQRLLNNSNKLHE